MLVNKFIELFLNYKKCRYVIKLMNFQFLNQAPSKPTTDLK